ncbi:MAG: TIGR04222 domain-containing membrane protein [Actinomycetota bacterium]
MEILFDNPLATMYGPYFLIIFGFVIFFTVIILAFVKTQFDKTDKLGIPSIPSQIDPHEIAFLRGGNNEVARSVIFSLLQKGFIEIDNSAAKPVIKKTLNQTNTGSLNQIEMITLGWLGVSREPKEFFSKSGLVEQLEIYGRTYQGRLEQQQFLTDAEKQNSFSPTKWTALLIIFGLGAYKTSAAIIHGRFNVILLIIFTISGLLIANAVAKLPRLTKLGKAYLERLQIAFDNLKYTSQAAYIPSNQARVAPQTTFAGVDPLLLSVGVFGAGILAGTVFDSYNQAFQRAQQASAISSSSCGSGCGSCSTGSSCSSGDGGGGSSCGGGCGGCGG